MTAAQLATLAVVVSILSGILGVFYMARQSSRESARLRQEDLERQVKEATDPLHSALQSMTASRDYWRARADGFEAELRKRSQ